MTIYLFMVQAVVIHRHLTSKSYIYIMINLNKLYLMKHRLKDHFENVKKHGKSQKDCADSLGITHRAMNRIVHNEDQDLKISQINTIAHYLGIEPVEIYNKPFLKLINCYQDENDFVHFYNNVTEQHFVEIPASSNNKIKIASNIVMENLNITRKYNYGFMLWFRDFKNPRSIDKTEILGLVKVKDQEHYRLTIVYKPMTDIGKNLCNIRYYSSVDIIRGVEITEIAEFVYSANPKMFNYKTVNL